MIVDGAVAEEFAQHFSTAGKNMADEIGSEPDDHPNKMGTVTANAESIVLRPVTGFETSCLIKALNERESVGIDHITAKSIRQCNEQLTPTLTKLINGCFSNKEYPDGSKVARVTSIRKSDSKKIIANYRPISVLPIFNNILERSLQTGKRSNLLQSNTFTAIHVFYNFHSLYIIGFPFIINSGSDHIGAQCIPFLQLLYRPVLYLHTLKLKDPFESN